MLELNKGIRHIRGMSAIAENLRPYQIHLDDPTKTVRYEFDEKKIVHRGFIHAFENRVPYETETTLFLSKILKPGDTFIDFGAHIGYFSCLAALVIGSTGRVISVEPNKENLTYLSNHKKINNFEQMTIYPHVMWDKIEEKTFFENSDNDGGHALWDVAKHDFNKKSAIEPKLHKVTTSTGNEMIEKLNIDVSKIKLIKMDVEGAELAILKGSSKLFTPHKTPCIVLEINSFGLHELGTTQKEVKEFFTSQGYQCFTMSDTGQFPKLIPNRIDVASNAVFNLVFSTIEYLENFWDHEVIVQ
jgi:FkbM family methyltransferase